MPGSMCLNLIGLHAVISGWSSFMLHVSALVLWKTTTAIKKLLNDSALWHSSEDQFFYDSPPFCGKMKLNAVLFSCRFMSSRKLTHCLFIELSQFILSTRLRAFALVSQTDLHCTNSALQSSCCLWLNGRSPNFACLTLSVIPASGSAGSEPEGAQYLPQFCP